MHWPGSRPRTDLSEPFSFDTCDFTTSHKDIMATSDTSNNDRLGPVDHVIVEFPAGHIPTEGFTELLSLVERGIVRILDLEFITVVDGTATTVTPKEVGEQLAIFEGSGSELLDDEDLRSVAGRLTPGSIAAVLVYEHLPMLAVERAWEHAGATVLAEGSINIADLEDALHITEPTH
ncbi:hypothetical protein ACFYVD_17575 [Rhodococcus pyridinivorans]|uniref:hypothetical protein n=1 Tax=Rhodococcus pyridinivorans TaxID=103816 RepID=UPI0036BC599D